MSTLSIMCAVMQFSGIIARALTMLRDLVLPVLWHNYGFDLFMRNHK